MPTTNKGDGKMLGAFLDPALVRRLRARLAADGLSYKQWLKDRVEEYAPPVRRSRTRKGEA